MRHRTWSCAALAVAVSLAAGSANAVPAAAKAPARGHTAVVVVTGLSTTTPFTSQTRRCRRGPFPVGGNGTFLFNSFVRAGLQTYAAPVEDGPGRVKVVPDEFSRCPPPLPASMTVNSIGRLDSNSKALVRFLRYLQRTHGVTRVWVVGHSMGGLVSRGAIARLSTAGKSAGPAVLGLFTLASPHLGTFVADIGEGAMSQSVCGSEPLCLAVTSGVVATSSSYEPALSQLTRAFLVGDTGSTGWNERSGRVPRSIPVTTYAGQSETVPGNDDPYVSPNDAYVGLQSALPGSLKADGVLPSLRCAPATDDTHSRFTRTLAESLLGATPLPIIADPNVARSIVSAIRGHPPRSVC